MTELMQASHQWATRPADQRFLSLQGLHDKVSGQRRLSATKVVSSRALTITPAPKDEIKGIQVLGPNGHPADPNHWSFGQLAQRAGAPAGYLRTLPAPIAADALNYGLKFNRDVEEIGLLVTRDGEGLELRAACGPNYGRIWNSDVVGALIEKFGDGRTGDFRVPGEFGREVPITKDNTTIYGSDRDIFVFLADENNRIELPNRRNGKPGSFARGFFVWNSEVGSQSIGAAFFLFDYVCMNRIVWGVQEFKEIRLRHTAGAPDRWLEQVSPVLVEYANSSASPVEAALKAAQARKLDNVADFLSKRFTKTIAAQAMAAHEREEGRPIETAWDAVTGLTAYAKTLTYQDARVSLERDAGKVLDLVAA
jgi:hypothetical protein